MRFLRDYQRDAHNFTVQTLMERGGAGLLLGCGLGKTGVTLKALDTLRYVSSQELHSVLVAAPLRVLDHWKNEAVVWNTSLPVRVLHGTSKERLEMLATPFPGITVTTYSLLHWLTQQKRRYDVLVLDEASKFRNWSAKRTIAALKLAIRAKYRLLLTGTPCPNHTGEIFAQQALIDLGQTLGKTIGSFRDRFMYRGGFENREWIFDEQKRAQLEQLVAPYYLHQSQDDFLDIPPMVDVSVKVWLPPVVKAQYQRMQDELIAELQGNTMLAFSGSDRYRMSRQLASGVPYLGHKNYYLAHAAKIETLIDLLSEIDGPVLVAYQFDCERAEIRAALEKEKFSVEEICGGVGIEKTNEIIARVQDGTVDVVLVQNQAASHGIDGLQLGCYNLIWFTLPDDAECYDQLISRLKRTGQKSRVYVQYLQAVGTIDAAMLRMLKTKQCNQQELLKGLEYYAEAS